MNHVNIRPNERSLTQQIIYCVTSFMRNIWKWKIHKEGNTLVDLREWASEEWGMSANEYR
jgi:hypothetical protein